MSGGKIFGTSPEPLGEELDTVTRVEVICNGVRMHTTWGATNVLVSLQDDGRTLKVFYNEHY